MSLAVLRRAAAWGLQRSGVVGLAGRRARDLGIVLMYHRINDDADPLFPALSSGAFEAQVRHLAGHYQVEPLETLGRWLREGAPGPPRAAITIDDGYPDTAAVAHPILRRLGLPATLFLATSPLETGQPLWLDRLRWLLKHTREETLQAQRTEIGPWPLHDQRDRMRAVRRVAGRLKRAGREEVDDTMGQLEEALGRSVPAGPRGLTWAEVRHMADTGLSVGGHTHRHYILSQLAEHDAREEMACSLRLIRERLGTEVRTFAYPNGDEGDYTQSNRDALADLGVDWACSTRPAFARPGDHHLELPRLYTAAESLPLFACRLAGLTRLESETPRRAQAGRR
jgi:peptidoglycan/xylan/chitin deacetylase (PgdA/CDA1 family)